MNHATYRKQPALRRWAVWILGRRNYNIYGDLAFIEWRGARYWTL